MRTFTRQQAQAVIARHHNVGGLPATSMVAGDWDPAPANSPGGQCPRCPPGIDPRLWAATFRKYGLSGCVKLCNLSGGTPGLGYGGDAPPPSRPEIPVGEDGCARGWVQSKQPLAVAADAIGAGLTVTITVTPRQAFRAYQLVTFDTASAFDIMSLNVNGVEYLGSAVGVPAATYQPAVTDHSVDIGEFTSTTPLLFSVRNNGGAAANFRAVLLGYSART